MGCQNGISFHEWSQLVDRMILLHIIIIIIIILDIIHFDKTILSNKNL